jgi:hypothetical protein
VNAEDRARARRLLRWVAIVAIADTALLVPLVVASLSDADGLVSVLGPLHGIGFLAELYLAVRGVIDRYWGWWFPAIIVVTLGPLGALIGHRRLSPRLADAAPAPA